MSAARNSPATPLNSANTTRNNFDPEKGPVPKKLLGTNPGAAETQGMDSGVRIAVVGDLHGAWDSADTHYFNHSDYDLLLLTGDLGSGTALNGLTIAKVLARLRKPALVIAGNNDAPFAAEIAAEFKYQANLAQLMRIAQADGTPAARTTALCGYDLRSYSIRGIQFSVLVGRPYAMGGSELSFPELLKERYGVASLEQSTQRLKHLVDEAPPGQAIWLAHNGPSGLGSERSSIWGCDFKATPCDWGDTDLAEAIQYSQATHTVRAVIAGHMHRPGERPGASRSKRQSQVHANETLYVNAAVVPRIVQAEAGTSRHHMALNLYADGRTEVQDIWLTG